MTELAHHTLDALLSTAMQSNASDIILVAGSPATFRVLGALRADAGPALSQADIQGILLPLLTPAQTQQLHALKCLDLCLVNEGVGRIRANLRHRKVAGNCGSLKGFPAPFGSKGAKQCPT